MRHGISGRKLNRTSSHRKAMFANMATSLLKYEQIKTTLPKAKEIRPIVEKLITLGKQGDLAARRRAIAAIQDQEVVVKLMSELADRYKKRPGGYVRIVKAGFRRGDMAPMAVVELVDRNPEAKPKGQPQTMSTEETINETVAVETPVEVKKAPKKKTTPKKSTKSVSSSKKSAPKKAAKSSGSKEE